MKCVKARKLIPLHTGGDLDYGQDESVKEHIITCDACAAEAEAYRRSTQALSLLKSRTMPASYWEGYMDEIRERIHSETVSPMPRRWTARRIVAVVAAAAVLVLAVIIWRPFSNAKKPETRPTEATVTAQPAEAQSQQAEYAKERVKAIQETARADDF